MEHGTTPCRPHHPRDARTREEILFGTLEASQAHPSPVPRIQPYDHFAIAFRPHQGLAIEAHRRFAQESLFEDQIGGCRPHSDSMEPDIGD